MPDKSLDLNPFEQSLLKGAQAYSKGMFCCHVALIDVYDPVTQTASIEIAVNRITEHGFKPHPILQRVPVIFPGNRLHAIHLELQKGDEGYLLFSQRDIDNFLETGTVTDPNTKRMFSVDDAFFIPCQLSAAKPINNCKNDGVIITKRNGASFFHMRNDDTCDMEINTFFIKGDIVHTGDHQQTGNFDQTGDRTIAGSTTQTGDVTQTGELTVTGNATVSATVSAAALAASGSAKAGSMSADSIDAPTITSKGKELATHTHPIAGPETGPPS